MINNGKYPSVSSKQTLNHITLPNRIVFPPWHVNYANTDGTVSDKLMKFYTAFADGGCGLILTGAAAVSYDSIAFDRVMRIDHDGCVPGLKRLFSGISRRGSIPGIQLIHYGRQAASSVTGYDLLAPSAIPCPVMSRLDPAYKVREMTPDDIRRVRSDFIDAAVRAADGGAGVVEVHAAHGYLLNEFLSPYSNHRSDGYGGDPYNRARLTTEIIEGIRDEISRIAISVRVSGDEFVDGGLTPPDFEEIIPLFEGAGMDMLNVSAGVYESMERIVPPPSLGEMPHIGIAAELKRFATVPVCAVGSIFSIDQAESIISSGKSDLVAMGRAQVADPEIVKKSLAGQGSDIRECTRCDECTFWTTGDPQMYCSVNPALKKRGEARAADELYELYRAITGIDIFSPPRIYVEELLKVLCDNLRYRFGTVIEVDDHGKGWLIASYNAPEDYIEQVHQVKAPVLSSPSGEAIELRKIVVVRNALSDPRLAPWCGIVRSYNLKTVIWMPLFGRNRVFGTYVFYDTRIRDTPEELQLLEDIRVMVSIALTSNQYLDQLNQKTKELDGEIVERKRAEERARVLAERTAIIDAMGDGMVLLDMDGKVIAVNPAYGKLTGYEKNELVGRDAADLVHEQFKPEDLEEAMGLLGTIMDGISPLSPHLTIVTKDGREVPITSTISFIKDTEETPIHAVITIKDITELKRVEAALRESEDKYRVLFKTARDAIFLSDETGKFVDVNQAACGSLGYSKEELLRLSNREIDADPRGYEAFLQVRNGPMKEAIFEVNQRRKDGALLPVEINGSFFESCGKRFALAIARDITERKAAEEERECLLKELEAKNAEMERFTYTVSHSLRSPLTTIRGFAEMLRKDLEQHDMEKMERDLRYVESGAIKMDHMLNDTLQLSRIGRAAIPSDDVSFGELVQEALEQATEQIKSSGVEISVAEDFPAVHVDRMKMVEVLVNLIENGINYMVEQPHPEIDIGYRLDSDSSETVFFVRDNGMGIGPSQHEKAFELSYKVDRSSKGTGAGLAIVKRIIEVHEGRIWIESEKGKGCTVCFTLPLTPD